MHPTPTTETSTTRTKEEIAGGSGRKPEDVPASELSLGTPHEFEHTTDEATAREIAVDHLSEDPQYYTKLEEMESPKQASLYQILGYQAALEKYAARSFMKDFMAGVDPTGTATSTYGVQDAPESSGTRAARMGTGVAGGLIGGALAVPSAIYGTIGAVKGLALGGRKGAMKGFVQGLKKPIAGPIQGFKSKGVMNRLQQGQRMTNKDVSTLSRAAENMPGMSHYTAMAKQHPERARQMLQNMPAKQQEHIRGAIKEDLTENLAALGLSGVIGGGSAALQYSKGTNLGEILTPEQRAQLG